MRNDSVISAPIPHASAARSRFGSGPRYRSTGGLRDGVAAARGCRARRSDAPGLIATTIRAREAEIGVGSRRWYRSHATAYASQNVRALVGSK